MKNFEEFLSESKTEWDEIERINDESYAALVKIVGKRYLRDCVNYKDDRGRVRLNWNRFWPEYSKAAIKHPELINKDTWKTVLTYSADNIDIIKKIFSKYRPNKKIIINTMKNIAEKLIMGPSSDFIMSKLSVEEITAIIRDANPTKMWIDTTKNNIIKFFYEKGKVTFDKANETKGWSWRDMSNYLPIYYTHDHEFFNKIVTKDGFEFPSEFFLDLFDQDGGNFHNKEDMDRFIKLLKELNVYEKFEQNILDTKGLEGRELRVYSSNLTIEKILPKELIEKYYHRYRGSIAGKKYGV